MAVFTNRATLSYNGNTVNSNTVTGNIIEVLSATKTALDSDYGANDQVTYVVSITNSGTTAFTGLTVNDNLGEYSFDTLQLRPLDYIDGSVAYFQNGVLQPAPVVTSIDPLIFSGITVPASGNAILIYEARTNEFAPLLAQSTITNEVTVSGGGITPITAEETITVSDEPDLTITKSLSPVNVSENGELTYTFTVQNTGNTPAEATDNAIITDTFDPILSNITVTVNGVIAPQTSYTYNETTGEFATVLGTLTVPAATYTQDTTTGNFVITPGVTVVTVTGTV